MADLQVFKYSGENYKDYSLKLFNATIKTAKNWTELQAAVTIKLFSELDIYGSQDSAILKVFHRGYLQKALGAGIQFIETFGALEVTKHVPPSPKDKLCIEVPNNILERSETIGKICRIKCGAAKPDILRGYDKFVEVRQMMRFQRMKIGKIQKSIQLYMILFYNYILGIHPEQNEHAPRYNSLGITAMLGAKWDDTMDVGALLKELQEFCADEINKEKKLKNYNIEAVWDWVPTKLKPNTDGTNVKRWKSKTSAMDTNDLKKTYLTNLQIDPTLWMCGVARVITRYANDMMEFSMANHTGWPGNTDNEKIKKVGSANPATDAAPYARACEVSPSKMVVIMNKELYKCLKEFQSTSRYVESGAYTHFIDDCLKLNIVPVDTIPYGLIKMGDNERYNDWTLYDKILTDTLGQEDFTRWTGHRGFAFGIRELIGFKALQIRGLYMNPAIYQRMTDAATGIENWG